MCGICGVLNAFPTRDEQADTIERMTAPLQHRGPDAWGTYLAPEIAFGQTRLSIVDLACGHQPMQTRRFVVVYNGEIYNHIELRAELEAAGVTFATHCDTEVILHLFEREGPACIQKFNGQFAILVWDRVEQTLTAVRDRYGVRPLYVLNHAGRVYFSSEMKSFDALPDFTREFEPAGVLEHAILWNTLDDRTVYRQIRSVRAGCYETHRIGGSFTSTRYYEIGETLGRDGAPTSFSGAIDEFTGLLQDAVNLRLRSDVPVGAYLSGGIDSSVIAHLTKNEKRDDFRTFSVAFEDGDYDESRFQRMLSEQINSQLETVTISYDSINDSFMDAVYHTERPIFRTAPVPLFLLSQRVRDCGFKVVLTGEGADEILYGYDSFKELRLLEQWKRDGDAAGASERIKQLYPHLRHYNDPARSGMMRMYYEGFLGDFDNALCGLNIRSANNAIIANFLHKDHALEFDKGALLERLRATLPPDFERWTLLQRNSYLEIRTLLAGYLLSSQGDRMSLGHSVEGRYPFLDHRVVEAAFGYPDDFKLQGFSQKHLLREAFRGKVPEEILDRPKRPYMAPDLKAFFRNGRLTPMAAEFLSEDSITRAGLFDWTAVNRFLRKFENRFPEEIGYRDNMVIVFLLSAQIARHWAHHPRAPRLDPTLRTVTLSDY